MTAQVQKMIIQHPVIKDVFPVNLGNEGPRMSVTLIDNQMGLELQIILDHNQAEEIFPQIAMKAFDAQEAISLAMQVARESKDDKTRLLAIRVATEVRASFR